MVTHRASGLQAVDVLPGATHAQRASHQVDVLPGATRQVVAAIVDALLVLLAFALLTGFWAYLWVPPL